MATLSGGNQQRIVLAKWLATEPKVLILDSPTVGVDIKNKQGIYEIVRRLAESGVGMLLISDEVGGDLSRPATASCTCAPAASSSEPCRARSARTR